jgi:protein SCO1/2
MMVQKLKRMEKELKDIPDLQFVAISVDPEVDTPARLKVYAKAQGIRSQESFKLFTSSQAVLDRIVHETFATQVVARKNSSLRSFAHSEHFYLLDQQARLRGVLNGSRIDAPADARKMLVTLVEGKPSS